MSKQVVMTESKGELSQRELQILRLVAKGASNKEIAYTLKISTNTVKVHLRNIFSKINVNSRTEAALYAINAGIITVNDNNKPETTAQEPVETRKEELPTRPENIRSRKSWGRNFLLPSMIGMGLLLVFLIILTRQLPVPLGNNENPDTPIPVSWETLEPLPEPRARMSSVVFQDEIFEIGGETDQGITGAGYKYNNTTGKWTALSPKPSPVRDASAVVSGGKIFIPGGELSGGEVTDVLEIYDPRTDTWSVGPPLPAPLSAYGLVVFEGTMVLFGGWDGKNYVDTVLEYDPGAGAWRQIARMRSARGFLSVSISERKIILVGGYDGKTPLKICEAFLPDLVGSGQSPWEELNPLPAGRYGMGSVSLAENVYLLGGISTAEDGLPVVVYISSQKEWKVLEYPPGLPQAFPGVVNVGEFIHVIGGQESVKQITEHSRYQAIYSNAVPLTIRE